ncbi:MAG: hypothetical protein ACUVSS_14940 [Anaerolineae bacterium]
MLGVFAHLDDRATRPGGTLGPPARRELRVSALTPPRGQADSCGDPPST